MSTTFKFQVLIQGEELSEAYEVEAEDPEAAAEKYVENLCDGDNEYLGTNPHHIIVTTQGERDIEMTVEIDWVTTYSASRVGTE